MEPKSHSQIGQDLWVLEKTRHKRNGFFVEAGACDGILLSNTLLLEQDYGWNGICAEPNPHYYQALLKNRNCQCDNRALYSEDGLELEFYLAEEFGGTAEDISAEKARLNHRMSFEKTLVKTVSLNSLLTELGAPKTIDYISLDTEGSELKILEHFDFPSWDVSIFSVEHNTRHREDGVEYLEKLIALMATHGYEHQVNKWDSYFYR